MRTTKIKLDYDNRKKQPNAERIAAILRQNGKQVLAVRVCKSRSLTGWHALAICAGSIKPLEIVALQLLCGSDPKRELYNLYRVIRLKNADAYWRRRWNVLFRPLKTEGK